MLGLSRSTLTALLPGLGLLAVFAWWIVAAGGYEPEVWLPAGVLLVGGGAAVLCGLAGRLPPMPLPLVLALAAFAAYTAWSYASIAWADDPGAALLGSHRTLLFLLCFAFAACVPWTVQAGVLTVASFSLVAAAVALVTLLDVAAAPDPTASFLEGRFDPPLGYPNAAAALWTMAALPAVVLGSRRETPTALRPPLLASAVLLLETAILAQSRGWLFALPVAALVAFFVSSARVRLLAFAVPVAIAVAAALPGLLDPYGASRGAVALAAAFDGAVRAILVSTCAAAVAGAVLVVVDRRFSPGEGLTRAAGRAAAAAAGVLAVVVAVAAIVLVGGRPVDRLETAWAEFKGETTARYDDSTRFTALQSPRYATWRVAVDAWLEAPVVGLGQDNFAERYLLTRRTTEEPRWPHSLELRLLVHTGIIGALLFALALGAALVAAWRASRASAAARGLVVASVLPALLWVVHGSVDWLWEYPALSGPALGLLALAGRVSPAGRPAGERTSRPARSRNPTLRRAAAFGLGALALVATAALTAAFAAERHLGATGGWRDDPAGVMTRLDRAQRLSPLDSRPAVAEGLVAWAAGDRRRARRALLEAADRKPRGWFIQLQLGLLSGEVRDLARARAHLRAAVARNPRDDVVREALRRAVRGQPMSKAEADRRFNERWRARVGPHR